jgi:hypothetical protein
MSDYGADSTPDLNKAQDLAYDMGFLPLRNSNVMQWTYDDDVVVRKIANRQDHSNCLFKFED